MREVRIWSLILSLLSIYFITVAEVTAITTLPTNTEVVKSSEMPPIIEVRINGSPRLPAGTVVSVTVGGDCDTATPVRITIGPAGGGTARVDLNGCTPTAKTIPSAHALVGPREEYYCGKGVPIGAGGKIGSVTLKPC